MLKALACRVAPRALLIAALGASVAFAAQPVAPPPAPAASQPVATASATVPASSGSSAFTTALAALSPEEATYFQHNATLANPFFEGRAPGLRGNALAAEYVEFYFKKFGLEPGLPVADAPDGAPKGTFRQTFAGTFPGVNERIIKQQRATARAGAAEVAFEAGGDTAVYATSANGRAEGPLVFVGYSIEKGPDDYSTYTNADGKDIDGSDLTGAIALVLRLEPKNDAGKSKWATTAPWSGNANVNAKIRRAVQRGAAGVMLVYPPGADDARVNTLDPITAPGRGSTDVPVLQMTPAAAARLVAAAGNGADLDALTKAADAKGGITPLKGVSVTIETEVERRPIQSDNVAGLLRGKGALADQFLILGAHYDHVGYGTAGSRDPQGAGKLHPGADDNASGTAGLLLVAERLAREYREMPESASARSILFVAFSAEEGGLIGSKFFVRNSPVQASSTYAMLNMDMIGRLRDNPGLQIAGVGSAEGFLDLLKPLIDAAPMKVQTLPGGSGPSDHASFYSGGVPVLHFFTGLHREYHMPTDVFTTINTPGAVRVCRMFVDATLMLAKRTEPLVFTPAIGPSISRESPDDAPTPSEGAGPGGIRVRFGISPSSYADDKPGVLVGDVFENTSAADAGIKKDDRLMRWNGEEVASVQDWMRFLRAAKPGDLVNVVVMRGSEELTLPVTLKARETEGQ